MFNTATKAQMQELIEYIASKMSVIDVSTIADANNVEEGYFNETDNKFYKEADYITEITGKSKTIYISLNTDLPYYFNGTDFIALYSSQQNPSFNYSTSEKVVGTWIDGKPLYQKVVANTVTSVAGWQSFAHNIANIDFIMIDKWQCGIYNGGFYTYVSNSGIGINPNQNTDLKDKVLYTILQYTKITD